MIGTRVYADDRGQLPADGMSTLGAYGRRVPWHSIKREFSGRSWLYWWEVTAPNGAKCILNPDTHTITEETNGTLTVFPSIDIKSTPHTPGWHGWLEKGIWRDA